MCVRVGPGDYSFDCMHINFMHFFDCFIFINCFLQHFVWLFEHYKSHFSCMICSADSQDREGHSVSASKRAIALGEAGGVTWRDVCACRVS